MSIFASPHAHQGSSTQGVMVEVCIALLPCTLFGFYLFGWPAINLFFICCASALLTEALCLKLLDNPVKRVMDGSALLTGWLIALTLPPWAPWWIALLGAFFAVSIGKQLYGGLGQNVFNPAMLARVGLLIAFPLQMTTWVDPTPIFSADAPSFLQSLSITFLGQGVLDGMTGPTHLGVVQTALTLDQSAQTVIAENYSVLQAFWGTTRGSMGETSVLLILLGAAYLFWRGLISWEIPLSMIVTLFLLTAIAQQVNPDFFGGPTFHLLSGGFALGAFFIATDPVTSPVGRLAKCLFGAGCAAVIFIIRCWGSFPEAVAFGVLFMNAFTPLLDRYFKPRHYGRTYGGKPLAAPSAKTILKDAQQ